MKIAPIAALSLLVLSSFAATTVAPTKSELESMYDKAFREFDANHYDAALKALDAIDARQPDLAESENLRGVVLMRQGKYDAAEKAMRKALDIDPKFWNAKFNLAEIPFLKKDWGEARNRFEALVAGDSSDMRPETKLLIQYKVLLTFVLQGKENMVDWIMNKFEGEKESPALYYSNAAIALHHHNDKEAKEWMDAAAKNYPDSLNRLFAESFYEIGWLQKPANESRAAVEITSTAERAERMKADAQANYEKAERAFEQRDFPTALKFLDLADEGAPNQAPSYNLRGEVYMEQNKFDEAEALFRKAFMADPKFREAQYNLAQIPFKKKDYAKSRARFEALFGETPGGDSNQAAQLIRYKIYLTLLLDGKDSEAQKMMDQFKFTGDTPALYYAQAAWSFKHGNTSDGNDWVSSARKIYSPALNIVFADTFYDLGWLQHSADNTSPTSALAQANATPASAEPQMRLGETEPIAAPVAAATPATAAPVVATTAAAASPAASAAAKKIEPAPVAVAKAAPPTPAAQTKQTIASASTAITPAATALAPERIREWSQPTFAETMDRVTEPRTLLFGGLLLAGVLLLAWLIFQQVRRAAPAAGRLYQSLPIAQPRFAGPAPTINTERHITRDRLEGGPPKISLKLKGSEPSVRAAVMPFGATGVRPAPAASSEPEVSAPNDADEFVSEVRTIPAVTEPVRESPAEPTVVLPNESEAPVAQETVSLRDKKEISLAAAAAGALPAIVAEKIETKPVLLIEEEESVSPVREQVIPPFAAPVVSGPVLMSELTEPASKPEPTPAPIIPETAAAAAIAGSHAAPQSPIETPSFASKIITTQPTTSPSTTPDIMPEPTPITATNEPRPTTAPAAPGAPSAPPSASMQTAVQLTFSLEISSLQLTPTFKMGALQVKPISKIVAMRLAPSAQPQPAMNLQVTFELSSVQLGAGATLGTVRLTPSSAQRPTPITSPSFEISGLQLVSSSAAAPVQLTPTHQGQASVLMTASFQIATVEFSPSFEIASVVLHATSKNVAVQLPGAGPSSIEAAPVFEIGNVQLGGNNEIGAIQLNPLGSSARRA